MRSFIACINTALLKSKALGVCDRVNGPTFSPLPTLSAPYTSSPAPVMKALVKYLPR